MDGFIGEVRLFSWGTFAPEQWLACDGSAQSIRQFQALYAVIGNIYGGNAQQGTFGLPKLQGSCVVGTGQGPGLSSWQLAQTHGSDSVVITNASSPVHNHALNGRPAPVKQTLATPSSATMFGRLGFNPSTVAYAYYAADTPTNLQPMSPQMLGPLMGDSQGHENRQPFLVMSYCICWDGEFPVPS
jgi:microcystin-dependent protein